MVALAILAVALGALVQSVGYAADTQVRLRNKTLAHWVAMNTYTDQVVHRDWPSVGIQQGDVTLAGREWHWTIVTSGTPDKDMRRLKVEVRAKSSSGPLLATLIGFLGRP